MDAPDKIKDEIVAYLKELREKVIAHFEKFEHEKRFVRTSWDYQKGNGG